MKDLKGMKTNFFKLSADDIADTAIAIAIDP